MSLGLLLAITQAHHFTWIDELRVEVVSQLRYARGDLVELHALLLAIALDDVHGECARDPAVGGRMER